MGRWRKILVDCRRRRRRPHLRCHYHHDHNKSNSSDMIRYDMMYLLTAIGLTPGSSSTLHIYNQTIHRTTQLTRTKQ